LDGALLEESPDPFRFVPFFFSESICLPKNFSLSLTFFFLRFSQGLVSEFPPPLDRHPFPAHGDLLTDCPRVSRLLFPFAKEEFYPFLDPCLVLFEFWTFHSWKVPFSVLPSSRPVNEAGWDLCPLSRFSTLLYRPPSFWPGLKAQVAFFVAGEIGRSHPFFCGLRFMVSFFPSGGPLCPHCDGFEFPDVLHPFFFLFDGRTGYPRVLQPPRVPFF